MTEAGAVTNWEVFIWALGRLGGATSMVDVEDVFVKCFEFAPLRFSWRTRPDLPDYKKCAKALRDAEARQPALLIKRGDRFARQLTVDGQRWVATNDRRVAALGATAITPSAGRPQLRLLNEFEQCDAFRAWSRNPSAVFEKWRLADAFKCSPDSGARIWRERLETLRSTAYAAERTELLKFLDAVSERHRDWFGGDVG